MTPSTISVQKKQVDSKRENTDKSNKENIIKEMSLSLCDSEWSKFQISVDSSLV